MQVSKIKAHRTLLDITNLQEKWLASGNDKADALAKQTLQDRVQILCSANPRWSSKSERQSMNQAFLATQHLHDVSNVFFKCGMNVMALAETQESEVQPLNESQFDTFHFEPLEAFPGTE